MHRKLYMLILILLIPIFSGCGSNGDNSENVLPTTISETVTTTPISIGQTTPQPTIESTPSKTANLILWWPEPLAPADMPEVTDVLSQQIGAFDISEEDEIEVKFRLRTYRDVGGILSTLIAASTVAPGAMPDLTLIRSEDLATLVEADIVYPLEGIIPSTIIGNLYDQALELGQIDDQIYGLPYTLEILLMTNRSEELNSTWSFQDVLALEKSIIIPAGRMTTINETFYLQYLNAGGTPLSADGNIQLDIEAVETILQFYRDASALNIIDDRSLSYTNSSEYLKDISDGSIDIGLVTSSEYLILRSTDSTVQPISIPTLSGQPVSITNSWMWVMTTNDTDKQEIISRFLNWMMDINGQRKYAETIKMLPSQRTALVTIQNEQYDIDLFDELITNSILPTHQLFARPIQDAFAAIIQDGISTEDALKIITDQMGN